MKWDRPAFALKQTSASAGFVRQPVGISASQIAERSALAGGKRQDVQRPIRDREDRRGRLGASSIKMCAFVPLKPNELTPAMRRPAIGVQGSASVGTARRRASQSISGFPRWK